MFSFLSIFLMAGCWFAIMYSAASVENDGVATYWAQDWDRHRLPTRDYKCPRPWDPPLWYKRRDFHSAYPILASEANRSPREMLFPDEIGRGLLFGQSIPKDNGKRGESPSDIVPDEIQAPGPESNSCCCCCCYLYSSLFHMILSLLFIILLFQNPSYRPDDTVRFVLWPAHICTITTSAVLVILLIPWTPTPV